MGRRRKGLVHTDCACVSVKLFFHKIVCILYICSLLRNLLNSSSNKLLGIVSLACLPLEQTPCIYLMLFLLANVNRRCHCKSLYPGPLICCYLYALIVAMCYTGHIALLTVQYE